MMNVLSKTLIHNVGFYFGSKPNVAIESLRWVVSTTSKYISYYSLHRVCLDRWVLFTQYTGSKDFFYFEAEPGRTREAADFYISQKKNKQA